MKALGLIEVYGYLPAVEALDSALKAANVSLVDVTLVEGGLVTVMITGDVGAVKAAVEAAKVSAAKVSKLISVHVIARPSKELDKILTYKKKEIIGLKADTAGQEIIPVVDAPQLEVELVDALHVEEKAVEEAQEIVQEEAPEIVQEEVQEEAEVQEVEKILDDTQLPTDLVHEERESHEKEIPEHEQITLEEMQSMTVDRLRKLARDLEVNNMTRKEIRFATKHELIDKISKFIEEERD